MAPLTRKSNVVLLVVSLAVIVSPGCSGKKEELSGPKEDDRVTNVELILTEELGLLVVVMTEGTVPLTHSAEVIHCSCMNGKIEVVVKLWDDKEYTASAEAPDSSFQAGEMVKVRVAVAKPILNTGQRFNSVMIDNRMLAVLHVCTVPVKEK